MSRLYLLTSLEGCDYDEFDSFVVQAPTAKQARLVAADTSARINDDSHILRRRWLESKRSSCKILRPGKKPKLILGSFNAG